MHPISRNLPEYLHTRFSTISKKKNRIEGKPYKSPLTHGVSDEVPDFFKVKNVPVLTKQYRVDLHSANDFNPYRSLSKRNSLSPEKSRQIYRKLSLNTSSVDFNQTDIENNNINRAGLATGFGKTQGEFIVNTPVITRHLSSDQQAIQRVLEKISKDRRKRETTESKSRPVTAVYKVLKKKTQEKPKKEILYINPPELSKLESRTLYSLS